MCRVYEIAAEKRGRERGFAFSGLPHHARQAHVFAAGTRNSCWCLQMVAKGFEVEDIAAAALPEGSDICIVAHWPKQEAQPQLLRETRQGAELKAFRNLRVNHLAVIVRETQRCLSIDVLQVVCDFALAETAGHEVQLVRRCCADLEQAPSSLIERHTQ